VTPVLLVELLAADEQALFGTVQTKLGDDGQNISMILQ
jgi:hypothetical protein